MSATAAPVEQKKAAPRHQLVRIPRAVYAKYHQLPWAELKAAAERGDDGLALSDSDSYGFAWMREGDKGGMLEGKSSLFCQGW